VKLKSNKNTEHRTDLRVLFLASQKLAPVKLATALAAAVGEGGDRFRTHATRHDRNKNNINTKELKKSESKKEERKI